MDNDRMMNIFRENYNAALQFLVDKQKGHKMDLYLHALGYHDVVIYGMNDLANCIIRELKESTLVRILYTVDKAYPKLYFDIPCYNVEEAINREKPDIVIIALPYTYHEIHDSIEELFGCKTISITEIVYEMDK